MRHTSRPGRHALAKVVRRGAAWAYSALFLFLVLLSVELGVRGSAHDKAFD